jgi:predicted Zn-dependent peptidase
MYEDDPQDKVFDVLGEAVFGAHPLGRAVIGRAEVIAETPLDAIRSFHDDRYVPANIVVAAAGSVDHDELVRLVGDAAPAEPGKVPSPAAAPDRNGARVCFERKDTEQFHVCLGAPGIPRDDERRFALRVLDNIFGGTSSSRLFQEVRERRGLAYSVFSFAGHYSDSGQVGIYLGTRAENLAPALEVVAEQLEALQREPATAGELERSKENVKGRVVLSLESTTARMNRLGSSVLTGVPLLSVDEVIERIDAVTVDDLAELADELLRASGLSAAGIGTDESAFRTALAPVAPALGAAA